MSITRRFKLQINVQNRSLLSHHIPGSDLQKLNKLVSLISNPATQKGAGGGGGGEKQGLGPRNDVLTTCKAIC